MYYAAKNVCFNVIFFLNIPSMSLSKLLTRLKGIPTYTVNIYSSKFIENILSLFVIM